MKIVSNLNKGNNSRLSEARNRLKGLKNTERGECSAQGLDIAWDVHVPTEQPGLES